MRRWRHQKKIWRQSRKGGIEQQEKREITPGDPLEKMKIAVSAIMDKYIKEATAKLEEMEQEGRQRKQKGHGRN